MSTTMAMMRKMALRFARYFLFALLARSATAFRSYSIKTNSPFRWSQGERQSCWCLLGQVNENEDSYNIMERTSVSRRNFAQITTALTGLITSTVVGEPRVAHAADAPICVVGANGRTGTRCVESCIQQNIPVRATSRLGVYNNLDAMGDKKDLIRPMVCDVTVPETIGSAVEGCRAIIFAASASKQGGKPSQVDNEGLVNVAKAAIAGDVPHLVIVSSGGVSKPDSSVYKFLNIFGNIMAKKIKGEDEVRNMYKNLPEKLTYTIVRPGGLTEEPAQGVSFLELNQGDTKSGRISRGDVANICIEATNYPQLTGRATFECYDADTGKSLNAVGMSNIMKQTSATSDLVSGKERRGDNWQALFSGLEQDY